MSALFKLSPPRKEFSVPGVEGVISGWPKAIGVGGMSSGETFEESMRGRVLEKLLPPLSPARFAEELRRRRFTNGADFDKVNQLYADTLRDGFASRNRLAYVNCGWREAEVEELGLTLGEMKAPNVVELDLSANNKLRSIASIGTAISLGALPSLQTLTFTECTDLTSLPPELRFLKSLRTLNLVGCFSLIHMPDLSGQKQLEARRV